MALLTPGEYDDLPLECQQQLAGVIRHPYHDFHSSNFRKRYGSFANGDMYANPNVRSITGYGTGSLFAPHSTT